MKELANCAHSHSHAIILIWCVYFIALTIGFAHQKLLVSEGSVASLQISVLSGTLLNNVTIQFATEDITAIRKSQ